jgi:hypothetical protein
MAPNEPIPLYLFRRTPSCMERGREREGGRGRERRREREGGREGEV